MVEVDALESRKGSVRNSWAVGGVFGSAGWWGALWTVEKGLGHLIPLEEYSVPNNREMLINWYLPFNTTANSARPFKVW
jgi:hypothetical protein